MVFSFRFPAVETITFRWAPVVKCLGRSALRFSIISVHKAGNAQMASLPTTFIIAGNCFLLLHPSSCQGVLPDYFPSALESPDNRDDLIATYFGLGIAYTEILSFLARFHGVCIGLRQLKRVLRSKGLCRGKRFTCLLDVKSAIESEISGSGNSIGYRQMHQSLPTDHCMVVKRETVRAIMKYLDPEGVFSRSRRGISETTVFRSGSKLHVAPGWLRQTKTLWICHTWCYRWL